MDLGSAINPTMQDSQLLEASAFPKPQLSLLPTPRVELVPDLKRTSGEISHTQWESAQSLIRRLYIVENKPYKHVAPILQREYGFHPTKRQFERKVREGWGMKKYSTEIERRDLVRKYDAEGDEHFLSEPSKQIRSFNTAKLIRWKKGLVRKKCNDRSIPPIAEREIEPSVLIVIDEDGPEPQIGATSHGTQTVLAVLEEAPMAFVDDCAPYNGKLSGDWTIWNQSRILDSPGLDTLFSTLKLCGVKIPDEEIPTLSLAPTESSYEPERQYISNEDIRDLHNPFGTSKRQEVWLDSVSLERFDHSHQQQLQSFSAKEADTQHQLFLRAIESFVNPLNEIYPFSRSHVTMVQSAKPRIGNLHTAHLEYEERLQKLQRVLPMTHTGVITLMERLSKIYQEQENRERDLVLCRKLNAAKKELYGDNDPRTLKSYIDLNGAVSNVSFVKAMASHRPLHEALMMDFPLDDAIVRRSTILMSYLCRNLGQDEDAEKFSRQALQMCLNAFGPRDEDTLRAIGNLASTLRNKGVFGQSEHLLRIAIELHHETRGQSESEMIWNIEDLALIFESQMKTQESVNLFRRAWEHSRVEYGDDHPRTLHSTSGLARSFWQQGNRSESIDLLRKSVPRMMEKLGEGDLDTQCDMFQLAFQLGEAAKYQEAAGYYKRTFEASIQSLGIENSRTVWACIGLGRCYEEQELFKEASTLYESTIMEIKTVCSENHPSIREIQQYSRRIWRMEEEEELDEDKSDWADEETDEETDDDIDGETDEERIEEVEDYSDN